MIWNFVCSETKNTFYELPRNRVKLGVERRAVGLEPTRPEHRPLSVRAWY